MRLLLSSFLVFAVTQGLNEPLPCPSLPTVPSPINSLQYFWDGLKSTILRQTPEDSAKLVFVAGKQSKDLSAFKFVFEIRSSKGRFKQYYIGVIAIIGEKSFDIQRLIQTTDLAEVQAILKTGTIDLYQSFDCGDLRNAFLEGGALLGRKKKNQAPDSKTAEALPSEGNLPAQKPIKAENFAKATPKETTEVIKSEKPQEAETDLLSAFDFDSLLKELIPPDSATISAGQVTKQSNQTELTTKIERVKNPNANIPEDKSQSKNDNRQSQQSNQNSSKKEENQTPSKNSASLTKVTSTKKVQTVEERTQAQSFEEGIDSLINMIDADSLITSPSENAQGLLTPSQIQNKVIPVKPAEIKTEALVSAKPLSKIKEEQLMNSVSNERQATPVTGQNNFIGKLSNSEASSANKSVNSIAQAINQDPKIQSLLTGNSSKQEAPIPIKNQEKLPESLPAKISDNIRANQPVIALNKIPFESQISSPLTSQALTPELVNLLLQTAMNGQGGSGQNPQNSETTLELKRNNSRVQQNIITAVRPISVPSSANDGLVRRTDNSVDMMAGNNPLFFRYFNPNISQGLARPTENLYQSTKASGAGIRMPA